MNKFVALPTCLLLLLMAGCGNGLDEHTTIFHGVTIQVMEPTGNSSSHSSAYNAETKEDTFDLIAGDVKIQLKKTPEAMTFELNGQDYGKLTEGDIVRIDEARTATVNDVIRKPVAK